MKHDGSDDSFTRSVPGEFICPKCSGSLVLRESTLLVGTSDIAHGLFELEGEPAILDDNVFTCMFECRSCSQQVVCAGDAYWERVDPSPRDPLSPFIRNPYAGLELRFRPRTFVPPLVDPNRINALILCGNGWTIRYKGKQVLMPNLVGLHYIHKLIAQRPNSVSAIDLVGFPSVQRDRSQELMDSCTEKRIKERLIEIGDERKEVQASGNTKRLEELDAEVAKLDEYVQQCTGRAGKPRGFSSPDEKARGRVRKAIAGAISGIREVHQALADHLDDSIKDKSGMYPRYEPDEVSTWQLTPPA